MIQSIAISASRGPIRASSRFTFECLDALQRLDSQRSGSLRNRNFTHTLHVGHAPVERVNQFVELAQNLLSGLGCLCGAVGPHKTLR
jgi:hypothetical protein